MLLWISMNGLAISQTLESEKPAVEKTFEVLLKLAFPLVMTMVGPWVASWLKTAPSPVRYAVAGGVSMLLGAGAGEIPDFPLYPESAATIGLTSGIAGQRMYNMHPK